MIVDCYIKEVKARRIANTEGMEYTTTLVSDNKILAGLVTVDGNQTVRVEFTVVEED